MKTPKNMPEKKQPERPGWQPLETLEEIKMKEIGVTRALINGMLRWGRKWGVILGIGGAVGTSAGLATRDAYRDRFDYHPDMTEEAQPQQAGTESGGEKEAAPEGEEEKDKGLLNKLKKLAEKGGDNAKKYYEKARKEIGEKIEKAIDKSETVKELRGWKKKFLETGDTLAFWVPFLCALLLTAWAGDKATEYLRKKIEREKLRATSENVKLLSVGHNKLVRHQNQTAKMVNDLYEREKDREAPLTPEEAAKLIASNNIDQLIARIDSEQQMRSELLDTLKRLTSAPAGREESAPPAATESAENKPRAAA